jgi:hypothetical protein
MLMRIAYRHIFRQAIIRINGLLQYCGASVFLRIASLPYVSIAGHAHIHEKNATPTRTFRVSFPAKISLTRKLALLGKNNFEQFGFPVYAPVRTGRP